MRIQPLSSSVANQIAAGEVIERPASVVKELLDNAWDAGATSIAIELSFGGLNLIKVSDNGHGIYADDLTLAIAAHATSKMSQLTDLYAISTMGFRGEALASIASVSKLNLYSKPAEQGHGMLLRVDESGVHTQPFARTQGTTIEISDLFYNTPVRKTFLKTERLEYQAIELVVKQFALAAPSIAISLQHNQKQIFQLPQANCANSHLRRIKKLFGQAFLNDAIPIEDADQQFGIRGWISQRSYQRSQRDKQWVYLNNRFIKDKLVLQAIAQAYQDLLHPGRYSSCILYLTMPPDQVDINVHPTKQEVRFREPRMIHARIVSGLANCLHNQPTAAKMDRHLLPQHLPICAEHPSVTTSWFNTEDVAWQILNAQFAILRLQHSVPYLVDLAKVHHHFANHTLQTLPHPIPHRALLVPIRIAIETSAYSYLEQQRPTLLSFGIQFDFLSAQQVLIRTMPLSLPLLDLERFFISIYKSNADQNDIFKQLIACQTFDTYNMDTIERQTLVDYCLQNWNTMHTIQACLQLDLTTCQHIIRHTRSTERVLS